MSRTTTRAVPVARRSRLALPLVLTASAFAASCGMGSGTPLPDIGDTIQCTFESGHWVGGEVTDLAPGSAKIGEQWVNWEMVRSWHPADHDSSSSGE